jgi:RNA polymerase sigma-70 factor (ECF subfamily)
MDYSQLDDSALARKAHSDAEAFTTLYRRYVTPLYRYLYRRLGNVKDAEDLTAQVFTDALESLVSYRERGRFSAWLFTIAQRRLVDLYRQRTADPIEDVGQIGNDAGQIANLTYEDVQITVEQNETHAHLARLLHGLDEDRREILRLRFAAELGFSEIAKLLCRSEGSVKMTLYRTLDWLKANWEKSNE